MARVKSAGSMCPSSGRRRRRRARRACRGRAPTSRSAEHVVAAHASARQPRAPRRLGQRLRRLVGLDDALAVVVPALAAVLGASSSCRRRSPRAGAQHGHRRLHPRRGAGGAEQPEPAQRGRGSGAARCRRGWSCRAASAAPGRGRRARPGACSRSGTSRPQLACAPLAGGQISVSRSSRVTAAPARARAWAAQAPTGPPPTTTTSAAGSGAPPSRAAPVPGVPMLTKF